MDKEKELPQRKRLRLQNFDYSSSGAYFITICTKDRKMLFAPVGADSISARMVERTFLETIRQYDGVDSPIYVVMPNHFHAIITVSRADMESAPTVEVFAPCPSGFFTPIFAKKTSLRDLSFNNFLQMREKFVIM